MSKLNRSNARSEQGFVLVVGLALLAIVSTIGLAAAKSTSVGEKVTANYKNKINAALAATHGASVIASNFKNGTCTSSDISGCTFTEANKQIVFSDGTVSSNSSYWMAARDGSPNAGCSSATTFIVTGLTTDSTGTDVIGRSRIRLRIGNPNAADYVVQSGNDISINGAMTLTGAAYAGGNWSSTNTTLTAGSTIAAVGTVSTSSTLDPSSVCAGFNPVPVPLPDGPSSPYLSEITSTDPFIDCSTLSGDLGGATIRCNALPIQAKGKMNSVTNGTIIYASSLSSLEVELTGVTLVVKGDILDISSGTLTANSSNPNSVVATGNISASGNICTGSCSTVYTSLWSKGTISFNGNGQTEIIGTIISGSDLEINGGIEITAAGGAGAAGTDITRWIEDPETN